MGTLIVDTIGGRNDNAPNQSDGLTVTGVCSATDFSGLVGGAADFPNGLTGNITGNVIGNITGNVTSTGFSTFSNVQAVGIVTASSFKVGVGGTDIFSTIETKASTGKAIAMAMVFG